MRRISRKPGESNPEPWPSTRRTSWYSHGDICSRCSRKPSTYFSAAVERRRGRVGGALRGGEAPPLPQPCRLLRLDPCVLEPELRRLVHRLEEQLVTVHPLVL